MSSGEKQSSKSSRKVFIETVIKDKDIGTQNEIVSMLRSAGYEATQATVSRDIQELGLIKQQLPGGGFRYVKPPDPKLQKLRTLFAEAVIKIDFSENFIVIHTLSGSANTAAALIDRMNNSEIMGTIAGDDTVLIIIKHKDAAEHVAEELKKLVDPEL